MRKICCSSKTECRQAFNSRAEARSMPKGFSVITRAPSPSPTLAESLRTVAVAARGGSER